MASIELPAISSFPERRPALTGLILAGGAGQRMGGLDKGLQVLDGISLIQRVRARLSPQVDTLLISANRHHEDYAALGFPVHGDVPEHRALGYCGPLAGLYAGLMQAATEWVLCVPCDTPFLPGDLAQRLCAGIGSAPGMVARCAGRRQPTVCLLRRDLATSIGEFLAQGERKLGLWQQQNGFVAVDFPDPHAFANANTFADLKQLEAC